MQHGRKTNKTKRNQTKSEGGRAEVAFGQSGYSVVVPAAAKASKLTCQLPEGMGWGMGDGAVGSR